MQILLGRVLPRNCVDGLNERESWEGPPSLCLLLPGLEPHHLGATIRELNIALSLNPLKRQIVFPAGDEEGIL